MPVPSWDIERSYTCDLRVSILLPFSDWVLVRLENCSDRLIYFFLQLLGQFISSIIVHRPKNQIVVL
jgi:hypothetical protein